MKKLSFILLVSLCGAVQGGDWPAWRGPTGQGISNEKNLPLQWSEIQNVSGRCR